MVRGSSGRFSFFEVKVWGAQPPTPLLSLFLSVGFIGEEPQVGRGHILESESPPPCTEW